MSDDQVPKAVENGLVPQNVDKDPRHYTKKETRFPLHGLLPLYRPLNDAVASIIVNSKSEGASKFEIGKHIGLNVHAKSGSRKISLHIQQVCKTFPEHIDQFQKMTGKFRSIHYFLKNSTPENLIAMMSRFEQLSGGKCPFSFGQIIKFPGTGLNTLRISDVTFQRLLYILELLEERSVIVPSHKILRILQAKEHDAGYLFDIDKKSIAKCVLAMQKYHLCRTHSGDYEIDGVTYELEAVTKPDIQSFNDKRIQEAIEASKQEYWSQRRMFPNGVPMSKKMKQELDNQAANSMELKVERLSRKRRSELSPLENTDGGKSTRAKTIRTSTRQRRVKVAQNESYLSSCTHKFDGDIVESIIHGQALLRSSNSYALSHSDERGLLLLISEILSSLHGDIELENAVRFEDLFTQLDEDPNTLKKLRYLEKASLQLQLLEVHVSEYAEIGPIPLPELLTDPGTPPKLWLSPSSEINFPILRLLLESILAIVMNKPGITLSDLAKSHSFVLQSELMELIEILEEIGCLTFDEKMLKPTVKSSPFQSTLEEEVLFLIPAKDGLERFAAFIEQMDRTASSEV